MSQQGKRKLKVCWTYIHNKVFLRTLSQSCFARFDLANRGVRQPVQPHTFCAPLLVFDKALAQPHFAVVNCSVAMMRCFTPLF